MRRRSDQMKRRGAVTVTMVIVLIVLSLLVTTMLILAAQDQSMTVYRVQAQRTQFASDAAAAMAAKELFDNVDRDGDGGIGSISNDSNTATDPTLNGTRLWATLSSSGGVTTATARGQSTEGKRASQVQSAGSTRVFITRDSAAAIRTTAFRDATNTWTTIASSASTSASPSWMAAAPRGSSSLVLASDANNDLLFGAANSSGTATYSVICTDLGTLATRPFDVAVEPVSGDGMVVYFDNTTGQASYRTYAGSTLSASTGLGAMALSWARLQPMAGGTDGIAAAVVDVNSDAHVGIWNGSSWIGISTITTSLSGFAQETLDVALEAQSGRVMVAFADATSGRLGYSIYTSGSGWSAAAYLSGFGETLNWVRLATKPGSNEVFALATGASSALYAARWSGSAWSGITTLASSTGAITSRRFDVGASADGSRVVAMYSNGTAAAFYREWTGSAWGTESSFALASDCRFVQARPTPAGSDLIGGVSDVNGNLTLWSWITAGTPTTTSGGTTAAAYEAREWFVVPRWTPATPAKAITAWSLVTP